MSFRPHKTLIVPAHYAGPLKNSVWNRGIHKRMQTISKLKVVSSIKHVSDNERKSKFLISLCKYAYMHREVSRSWFRASSMILLNKTQPDAHWF
jgi:hypothetical protein